MSDPGAPAPGGPAKDLPPSLARLRRSFRRLMVIEAACALAAAGFAFAWLAQRQPWGLPGFALSLAVGFAFQIRFLMIFRKAAP